MNGGRSEARDMKLFLRLLGTLIIIGGFSVIVAHPIVFDWSFTFVEQYRNPDDYMFFGKKRLSQGLYVSAVLSLAIGIAVILLANHRIRETFVNDNLYHSNTFMPYLLFSISSLGGFSLAVIYTLSKWYILNDFWVDVLYMEDYLFESMTAVLFIASSFLLCKAALSLRPWCKKQYGLTVGYRWIVCIYLCLAGAFFFVGMEEISWGQRILGWETPSFWSEINLKKETNVHNLLWIVSPTFLRYLYMIPSILLIITLISAWVRYRKPRTHFYSLLLPHPTLIVLAMLIAVWSLPPFGGPRWQELIEELVALFAICYSFGIFKYYPLSL